MTAGHASRVLRAPGRLVANPTDLSVAYPYGGTELGLTRVVVLLSQGAGFRVESEALGEATDVLEESNHFVMSCFLRGWDDDAMKHLLADHYDAGAVSGHAVVTIPNRARPGSSALVRAKILLYVPDDLVGAPALLIYRGVPDIPAGAEIAFQRREELGVPITVDCIRDSNGNILQVGRFADLSLSP